MADAPSPPPPDTPPPSDAGRSPRRWTRIALVVSLGLNLLIIGLFVGAAADHRRDDRRPQPAIAAQELGLGPYLRALPEDQRRNLGRKVFEVARSGSSDRRPIRHELRQGFREVLGELRSEEFDQTRTEELLAGQSAAIERQRSLGQAALVQVLSEMSHSERIAYADRLEQSLRRGPKRP